MARRGVEGRPTGRRQVCAQELVDAGGAPAFTPARDEAAHDRLDDRPRRERDQAELRAGEPDQLGPSTLASPCQRRTEQSEAVDPVGILEPDLQRDTPTKAVADQMSPVELECVEQVANGARKEASVVARADRLVGVAEAWEVDRDHAEASTQRSHGGDERRLSAAEPMESHDRLAAPGFHDRQSCAASGDHPKPQASRTGQPARCGEEPDADVQVAPHSQAARAIGVHSAANVFGDGCPRLRIGGKRRVGVALGGRNARCAAIDHDVPRVAPENCETDARQAALRLERHVVITTGQPPKRARRRSHERSGRSTARRTSGEPTSMNNVKAIGRGSAFLIFPPCASPYTRTNASSTTLAHTARNRRDGVLRAGASPSSVSVQAARVKRTGFSFRFVDVGESFPDVRVRERRWRCSVTHRAARGVERVALDRRRGGITCR